MRFYFFSAFLPVLFLTGCANEGVIVQKNSVPLPFYESLGVDASRKLALRDSSGAVHSQLVNDEVFDGYAEGQYFNDLQPAATQSGAPAMDMEPGPYIPPRTVQNRARGTSPNGNGQRVAAKANGSGHSRTLAKASQSSTKSHLASAPSSVEPRGQAPVVSGQFAAPVQESASIHPLTSLDKLPSTPAVAARTQTATGSRSVVAASPVLTQSVPPNTATVVPNGTMAFTTPARTSASSQQNHAPKKTSKSAVAGSSKKKKAASAVH